MLIFQTLYLRTVDSRFAHIMLLIRRLALAYGIYSLSRLLFFAFHSGAFSGQPAGAVMQAFIQGLRFDTTAIVYVFAPAIVLHLLPLNVRNTTAWQRAARIVFMLGVFISLLLNFIDIGYFSFSGKRSGMELLRMQHSANASPLVYISAYWYLPVLLIALMVSAWKLYPKQSVTYHAKNAKQYIVQCLILFAAVTVALVAARGGFGLKPLNTLDAARFTSAELMPLTLNTPFQFLLTVEQVGVEPQQYMSDEEALRLFNPHKTTGTTNTAATKKNVVLIIIESLGKEYVGYYNNGSGYTPFLDSLMQHSTVYDHAYSNGKRSIEGIPAIIAAMPSWMPSDYINSFYQSNTLHGIGYYLQKSGYHAGFYHGGKNGTMSFDKMVAATGAGNYYGLNEYPAKEKDFDGTWGIFDEPYLQYVAQQLNGWPQPFFGTVFTLSSHHPYALPAAYKNVFKGGPLPIHATIRYADHALRQFFETASSMPWYANTVFILTADHSSENTQARYLTGPGKYEIPLVVFEPGKPHERNTATIDQLAITDLVLNRTLPANTPYYSLSGKYAIQYESGVYQLVADPYVLKFYENRAIELYDTGRDTLMQHNLINTPLLMPEQDSLEKYLKAVIQVYNNGLIRNRTH